MSFDIILAISIGILSLTVIYKLFVSACGDIYQNSSIKTFRTIQILIFSIIIIELILIASYDLVFGYDLSSFTNYFYILFLCLISFYILLIVRSTISFRAKSLNLLKLFLITLITRIGLFSFLEFFGMIPYDIPTAFCKNMPDGVYEGRSRNVLSNTLMKAGFSGGRIVSINIIRGVHSGYGKKAFQLLPDRIIMTQNPDIDAVSGATRSSKIIKSAVGDACRNAHIQKRQ